MRGRSVMVLTIVAFAFLVFTWVGVEVLQLAHGPWRRQDGRGGRREAAGAGGRSPLGTGRVREALAFDGPQGGRGSGALARTFPGNEFVVLSTCNRVEIYAAGDAARPVPRPRP